MGVAEEYEEMEEYSRQLEQMKNQVSNLTDALSKLQTEQQSDKARKDADCMSEGCSRAVDWYCKHCKSFICTKCSKQPCTNKTGHELTDFEEMFSNCKSKYMGWKMGKESTLGAFTNQKLKLSEEIATESQKIARASPDDMVSPEMARLVSELPAKIKLLQDISKQVEDSASSLSSSGVSMESLSQMEFIQVFNELDFNNFLFEVTDLDQISMSDTCDWVAKQKKYDVDITPTGDVLVGGINGFDICNKEGEVLRSVPVKEGNVTGIQHYKDKVYTLFMDPKGNGKRGVIVFDIPSYTECVRWEVPDYAFMSCLAVCNDKVYVVDPKNKIVKIYSPTGSPMSDFYHSTFKNLTCMNSCPPDGVLVADWGVGIVYKIDCGTDRIAWQFKVENPHGVCCDHLGNLWVWSSKEKAFIVRSSDGNQVKRFSHQGMLDANASNIHGMVITDGYLWGAACVNGVIKIKVNIEGTTQTKTNAYKPSA